MTLAPLAVMAGVLTCANASWAATTAVTPPTVKMINPAPVTVHLKLGKDHKTYTASFNLSIENDGSQPIAGPTSTKKWDGEYELTLVSDRNYTSRDAYPGITPGGDPVSLAATAVTPVPVTLAVHDSDTTTLTVVLRVKSPSGVTPSTLAITLVRSPISRNYWGILGGSLAVGGAVLLAACIFRREPKGVPRIPEIYTDATYSFSQSWVTSVSAILAVVATVFTSTGILGNLVPGIDTGYFLAVTIVFGVVLTVAPLVYSALQAPHGAHVYGTRRGFISAAAITGAAVGGQLSTVGAIISLADLPGAVKGTLWILLGTVALIVVWYTEMSRRQLWQLPSPSASPASASPTPAIAALP